MKKFDAQIFMSAVRHEAGETTPNEACFSTLKKLLVLDGEEFLLQAYRIILGREIDNAGLAAYTARSKTLKGKIYTLGALWFSPERVYLRSWQRKLLKAGAIILRGHSTSDKTR